MNKEKKGLEASFKSMDTEEFLDIHFNRPIGYVWALFFNRFGVHPNVVTVLSIFLGIGAGVMFYYPDIKHTIAGIFLLMWANHYDSCDGQLARMTGKKTRWGRMLDGFAGDIWFFAIYFAICLRLTFQVGGAYLDYRGFFGYGMPQQAVCVGRLLPEYPSVFPEGNIGKRAGQFQAAA